MNTNGLAKHYDKLTPRERFALIMAALARDDELEGKRLFLAAPPKNYSRADYHGVAMSFFWLSGNHFMSVLDLAACYLEAFADLRRTRKKDDEEASENVMALGYVFQTYLVGWRKFCADMNMDPEYVWKLLPGFDTIQRADSISGTRPDKPTPGVAFVEEGAARWLMRQKLGDEAVMDKEAVKAGRVVNADGMAANLHANFERLMETWG